MPEQKPKVTIRMYCHGFGDCFLLTFDNRGTPYRILIDCGMLTGNSNTLKTAIRNIHDELRLPDGKQSKIDVVVQTHEHKDHISGFNLRDEAGNLLWDSIKVGQVWQAWTEDPDHCLASELKEKQLKKKKALDKALELYLENITSGHHVSLMADQYNGDIYLAAEQRYANALKQLLEFNHTADEVRTNNEPGRRSQSFTKKKPSRRTVKNAMDYFSERDPNEKIVIKYFRPGDLVGKNETGLHGVKFYVLGPPEDYKKLRVMDDPKHEEMYLEGHGPSENFFMALTGDNDGSIEHVSPFSKKYFYREEDLKNGKASLSSLQGDTRKKTKKAKASDVFDSYYDEDQAWRQIDIDWLHNTGLLALHLDSYTNNTSLVLAIELETDDDNKERVLR
jgi:hypothetical protein